MSDLPALLERVKAAKGPDRELDVMLADVLDVEPDPPLSCTFRQYVRLHSSPAKVAENANSHHNILNTALPRYTASIDAALALVERKLPGTMRAVGSMEFGPFCRLVVPNDDGGFIDGYHEVLDAKTEPLAIIAALLTALIAKGGKDE
jgi:hypothetical protein